MSRASADLSMKIIGDKLTVSEDVFLITPPAEKSRRTLQVRQTQS